MLTRNLKAALTGTLPKRVGKTPGRSLVPPGPCSVTHAQSEPTLSQPLTMPFYQVLCIAAHNPEYVCFYQMFPGIFLCFHIHSDKSRASYAWLPLTFSAMAVSFAGSSTGAPRHFPNVCDHMEPITITESTFCHHICVFRELNAISTSYWTMHFDASPEKQKSLSKLLRKDPRVVRATVLKMGERIEDVAWKQPKTIIPAKDLSTVP